MTTFDQWLAALAAAGKLARDLNIRRGIVFEYHFALVGNWAGSVVESSLRAQPDAGSPLVTFTATSGAFADEVTVFTLSLSAVQTDALPTDPTGEGVVRLAWDVLITPPSGPKVLAFGATANVIGEVTNG